MAKYNWGELWPQVEDLLQQGINKPSEIAKLLDIPYAALHGRIKSQNLFHLFDIQKSNGRKRPKPKLSNATGVPMEQALTPEQCEKMRIFLSVIETAARKASSPNVSKILEAIHREGFVWGENAGSGESV